jgi:hypothetical protein
MKINIPNNIPNINNNLYIDKKDYNNFYNLNIYNFVNEIYNDDFEKFNYIKNYSYP